MYGILMLLPQSDAFNLVRYEAMQENGNNADIVMEEKLETCSYCYYWASQHVFALSHCQIET